jgi:hypothetical protein
MIPAAVALTLGTAGIAGSGCSWSLPNQSGWQSQISAIQAQGGDVSISFGGYTVDTDGTDLGAQCSSASAMAAQVESVVTTLGVSHLDFDIESNEETNTADITLTAQALDDTAGQLESIYGISAAAAYGMLGNTPMIGQNDTSGEIFTLADAATVESYAAQQGIALLSFWAEGRDNGGCPNAGYASSTCSGISQSNGAFTQAFQPFTTGGGSGGGGGGGNPSPTPTPTPTPPGSCAPAWVNNTAYVSGNEVSYGGDNWVANQWNYDEVPGGPSGAWNNAGAC